MKDALGEVVDLYAGEVVGGCFHDRLCPGEGVSLHGSMQVLRITNVVRPRTWYMSVPPSTNKITHMKDELRTLMPIIVTDFAWPAGGSLIFHFRSGPNRLSSATRFCRQTVTIKFDEHVGCAVPEAYRPRVTPTVTLRLAVKINE